MLLLVSREGTAVSSYDQQLLPFESLPALVDREYHSSAASEVVLCGVCGFAHFHSLAIETAPSQSDSPVTVTVPTAASIRSCNG